MKDVKTEERMYMQALSSSMCKKPEQFSSFGHPRIISLAVNLHFHMTSIETKPMAGTGWRVMFCLLVSLFVAFFRHDSEPASPVVKQQVHGDVEGLRLR